VGKYFRFQQADVDAWLAKGNNVEVVSRRVQEGSRESQALQKPSRPDSTTTRLQNRPQPRVHRPARNWTTRPPSKHAGQDSQGATSQRGQALGGVNHSTQGGVHEG